jgi:hypothetical protein
MHPGGGDSDKWMLRRRHSDVQMARPVSQLRPEFDDFLYASIGEDKDEMQLSVISALTRLELDPWAKAAELAQLTREDAAQRLALLIAELPSDPSHPRDSLAIATCLVGLLPSRRSAQFVLRHTLSEAQMLASIRATRFIVLLGFLMGFLWVATRCQPPARFDKSTAPTSSGASPVGPSQGPDQ